jgi:RNA polymerase sigma-70 factor (ECF subfamily)
MRTSRVKLAMLAVYIPLEMSGLADLPDTRESLLLKLRDPEDAAAWQQFVAIYRPAIVRLARRRGLQDADAEDLAQQVMAAVAQAVGEWRKDAARGTFRGWLLKIARNTLINAITRGRRHTGRGGTSVLEQLAQRPAAQDAIDELIEDEHRRAVFRWAAEEVRGEFHEATWLAFWRTTVDGRTTEQAAQELHKSLGSVYAARSRVMRRLQEKIRELERQ